ncbi:MAG: hypothetical protein KBH81_14995 [Phycisphaerae bacterium]|nr:hypothetical protein [Phycisphaerae bacterium]NLG41905.1 hypothetical protein [Phycisphaerae bacterium]
MIKTRTRGRLLTGLAALTGLALAGCPLTDIQQAAIVESTITGVIGAIIQIAVQAAAGV